MQRLMTEISNRDRIAFVRYAIQGVPADEAARELELTLDQLYQIKSRTLKQLRALIARQVEEEG